MEKNNPPAKVQWICAFCGISGITLTGFFDLIFSDASYILFVGFVITTIVTAVAGVVSAKIYQKKLSKKDVDLSEKDEEIRELNEQYEVLIRELNEQCEVLKKILVSEKPAQAGYYMTNKTLYDNFKTKLEILNCNLDVGLEDYHLHFKWNLTVLNPTKNSVEKAKFIYSGDKNDNSPPNVTFKGEPASVTMKSEENAVGDDRFIEIDFPGVIKSKSTANICIDYILPTYKFNPDYDFIWLVPDALGFAGMSEFRIRFFSDGEIIKNTTSSVLRSYKLSGKYPQEDDKLIPFKQLGEGKEGFESKKQGGYEELKGHGFLMILINDMEKLPYYLRNIPTHNN